MNANQQTEKGRSTIFFKVTFLAEMALAEGDKETAWKHAEIAKERTWCDGPPYCYKKALDEAEQMPAKLK